MRDCAAGDAQQSRVNGTADAAADMFTGLALSSHGASAGVPNLSRQPPRQPSLGHLGGAGGLAGMRTSSPALGTLQQPQRGMSPLGGQSWPGSNGHAAFPGQQQQLPGQLYMQGPGSQGLPGLPGLGLGPGPGLQQQQQFAPQFLQQPVQNGHLPPGAGFQSPYGQQPQQQSLQMQQALQMQQLQYMQHMQMLQQQQALAQQQQQQQPSLFAQGSYGMSQKPGQPITCLPRRTPGTACCAERSCHCVAGTLQC